MVKNNLSSFVMDGGRLHLRAIKHIDAGSRRLTVISNVPMTPELLHQAGARFERYVRGEDRHA